MSDEKPREWWIHSTGNAYTRDVSSNFPVVHVIEYSAYEAVVKERDSLLRERDAYAKAMVIALGEGLFINKNSVKEKIEALLVSISRRKGHWR